MPRFVNAEMAAGIADGEPEALMQPDGIAGLVANLIPALSQRLADMAGERFPFSSLFANAADLARVPFVK